MTRTNVYLTDEQRDTLKAMAKKNHCSMGEEIRTAIHFHIDAHKPTPRKTRK